MRTLPEGSGRDAQAPPEHVSKARRAGIAEIVRHIRNRRIIRRWEEEDSDGESDVFDWDHILEDAEAWKRGGSDRP